MTLRYSSIVHCAFGLLSIAAASCLLQSCSSSTSSNPPNASMFTQTNLVSDTGSFAAVHSDPGLINAWGIAVSPTGKFWVSSNHGSSSTIYDSSGNTLISAVMIPRPDGTPGGAPSGIVFNSNAANFGGGKFIFSTEDGSIVSWSSGANGVAVAADTANGAVFKGLAIVSNTTTTALYATDFHNGKIDVFDNNFHLVNHFTDPLLPPGFGPFGIQNINDTLYVTFARQKQGAMDDSAGVGVGYVLRYTPSGTLIDRFASGNDMNSPWGVVKAGPNFGDFSNAILIGNFGDGHITGFSSNGSNLGQLKDKNGNAIAIEGLWGLAFNPATGSDETKLFFAAGPFEESHGLFGYLQLSK